MTVQATASWSASLQARTTELADSALHTKVSEFMTPLENIVHGNAGITLSEANDIIWENKEPAANQIRTDAWRHLYEKDHDSQ